MSRRSAYDHASTSGDHPDLLAKRVTTVQDLRREMLDRWNNKSSAPAPAPGVIREIPVPLRIGETVQEYTKEFEMWLLRRNETFETLRYDPSRERGFWFSFAHKRAGTCTTVALGDKVVPRTSDMDELISHYGPRPEDVNKRMRRSNSESEADRGHHATESSTYNSEAMDSSAIDLSADEEVEPAVSEARPRDQGSECASLQSDGNVAASRTHRDGTVTPDQSECSTNLSPDDTPNISLAHDGKEDAAEARTIILDEDIQHVQHQGAECHSPLPRPRKRSMETEKEFGFEADAAVHRDLELAIHCQVSDDKKLQLALSYDRLDQQIATAAEIGDHISEPANSNPQLRSKRTAVLAALIVSNWSRRQESLVAVLAEEFAGGKSAKPENLATLLSEVGEKSKELKMLEDQRDTQVQLLRSLPPAATAAGRALRLKKLRKLSAGVSEKREAQERLQCEFEGALKQLMQSDGKARKLVKDALGAGSAA